MPVAGLYCSKRNGPGIAFQQVLTAVQASAAVCVSGFIEQPAESSSHHLHKVGHLLLVVLHIAVRLPALPIAGLHTPVNCWHTDAGTVARYSSKASAFLLANKHLMPKCVLLSDTFAAVYVCPCAVHQCGRSCSDAGDDGAVSPARPHHRGLWAVLCRVPSISGERDGP